MRTRRCSPSSAVSSGLQQKSSRAFSGVPVSQVVDAMGGRGALHHAIKPLSPSTAALVGVAVTCHCGPADNLAVFGALDAAVSGDVIVAATDSFAGTAVTGDLVLGMARNKGLAGFVTDGLVRDVVGIEAVGLPVYCAGVIANSPARNGPGTVGFPVVLGGVAIAPGDILVGDRDGIAVVPRLEAEAVLSRLAAVRAAEQALDAQVRQGSWRCPTSLRPSSDLTGRATSTDSKWEERVSNFLLAHSRRKPRLGTRWTCQQFYHLSKSAGPHLDTTRGMDMQTGTTSGSSAVPRVDIRSRL